jgi:hypothetical protein
MSVRPTDRFASVHELGRALFPFASEESQREFDDFYHRAEIETTWPESSRWRRQGSDSGARAAATQALPRDPVPTWQRRTTHTSAHPVKRRSRSRPSMQKAPTGRSRFLLSALAVGAVLAVAALVLVVLALRP